jgi:hypothetical protein
VANPGVIVSNIVVASATQITATFAIAANATAGNTNVTVITAGGTSLPATFGITLAAPSITSITPSSGVQGASVPITINGTNFVSGATVAVANPGVTVSNVVVASAVQITATFAIASGASTGNTNVTVTTSGGTSPAASFSVTAATAFTPIRIDAGSSTPYTDPLGQVWAGDSNFTGGGPVSNANPVSGTPVPALYQTAHYGPVSPALAYQFAVPNGSYIINLKFDENVFTQAGQRVFNILVNGQNVVPNFDIFARAGAQFQAVDVAIPVAVTTGQISIQFASVVSNPRVAAVEILPSALPAPTLTALSPNSASAGASVPVTITGSNFNTDVVINAGSNITVSNVTLVSTTQMTATFTVAAGAAPGARNVIVSTPGGTTPPLSFTVQ